VIEAVRLARPHDLDVHAGVRPSRLAGLEVDGDCSARTPVGACISRVEDEWLVHPLRSICSRRSKRTGSDADGAPGPRYRIDDLRVRGSGLL
jgi:hypothetical protein